MSECLNFITRQHAVHTECDIVLLVLYLCLSVCLYIYTMLVLCLNEWRYHHTLLITW